MNSQFTKRSGQPVRQTQTVQDFHILDAVQRVSADRDSAMYACTMIDALLSERHGAVGSGLRTKIFELQHLFSSDLLAKLHYLATVRNDLAHHPLSQVHNGPKFVITAREVLTTFVVSNKPAESRSTTASVDQDDFLRWGKSSDPTQNSNRHATLPNRSAPDQWLWRGAAIPDQEFERTVEDPNANDLIATTAVTKNVATALKSVLTNFFSLHSRYFIWYATPPHALYVAIGFAFPAVLVCTLSGLPLATTVGLAVVFSIASVFSWLLILLMTHAVVPLAAIALVTSVIWKIFK